MLLGHDLREGQRTQDVQITEDVSFDTMLLSSPTLKGLRRVGFLKPSPIQLHGIPLGKCGFDLLLEAKSGTGKTAVFTVIALEKLDLSKGVQAIMLAPTREIASQISDVISAIGSQFKGLNVAVVMGGLPIKKDVEKFQENVHIVVGSPGRLRHLIHQEHIDLSSVRLFVLDEADKLLEKSFLPDVNFIFSLLPRQKQVIMSSATYNSETRLFINKYVQKAQHVCPDSNCVLLGIEQKVTIVPNNSNIVKQTKHRYEELKKIFNGKQFKQCLIFCNYQVRVGELHRMLAKDKWPAGQLYGQQEQTDRLDALKTLQEYKCRILVSTDLAARGIDASNVDLVINFEPPYDWQTYLHRIGRAGRFGSYGTAISILSDGKEKTKFKETLGLTNMPFVLQYLWTEEPFNLNLNTPDESVILNETSAIICSGTNVISDEKKEDLLWKLLTTEGLEYKNNDNALEISTFQGLCESFKMFDQPSIESFSDLMHSFTVNQHKDSKKLNTSNYQHVKVTKLPYNFKNYIENFEIRKNILSSPNGDSRDSKIKESLKFVEELVQEQNIINQQHSSINDKENKSINTPLNSGVNIHKSGNTEAKQELFQLLQCCNPYLENGTSIDPSVPGAAVASSETTFGKPNSNSILSNYNENISNIDEVDPIEQVMIDAGLPTAFGKPKENRARTNAKKNHRETVDNHDYSYNHNKQNRSIPKVETKPFRHQSNHGNETKNHHFDKIKYQNKCLSKHGKGTNIQHLDKIKYQNLSNTNTRRESNPSSSTDEDTDHLGCCSETINLKQTNLKSEQNGSSNLKYTHGNQCNSKRVDRNQALSRSKQFDIWYNQLKQHMKSIQYTVYMEELQKL